MKIGAFVKQFTGRIFDYCEKQDYGELERLQDSAYSKRIFDVNFPFCKEVGAIEAAESKRYWTDVYVVRGKSFRVTSQWFDSHVSKSRGLFRQYLLAKGLARKEELALGESLDPVTRGQRCGASSPQRFAARRNARYRGNAIGNAQNLLVRNLLSNLGEESFNETDWEATKDYFDHRCAYCGSDSELVIEHAIPINRQSLGEHRLGNLVPSCRSCNTRKGDKDFREFLSDDEERIARIERYMDEMSYVPLGDNEQVRMILDMAHQEVAQVADRYLKILNVLFEKGEE